MNHDYSHCFDWHPDCPSKCFRGELVKDLIERPDLWNKPVTWSHFKGTEECPKKEVTK